MIGDIKKIVRGVLGLNDYERILQHRMLLSGIRSLPQVIIPGVQKGGTTSLFHFLAQHPSFGNQKYKEIHFFNRSYGRGLNYYKAAFPLGINKSSINKKLFIDASPDYFDNPSVPKKVRKYLPDVKLVFLLRNPIDRAYSHFQMIKSLGYEDSTFEQAIYMEDERLSSIMSKINSDDNYYNIYEAYYNYLSKGYYAIHLNRWLKYFSKSQMLVIESEDFFKNPQYVYKEVTDFLGIESHKLDDVSPKNTRSYSNIDPLLRSKLQKHYKVHNESLYKLLGKDFSWE